MAPAGELGTLSTRFSHYLHVSALLQLSPRCAQRAKYGTGAPFTLLSVTGDVSTLYANPDAKAHWRKVMNASNQMNTSTQWKAADENIVTLLNARKKKRVAEKLPAASVLKASSESVNIIQAPAEPKPDKGKFDLDSNASCYLMVDTIDRDKEGKSNIGDRKSYNYLLEQLTARLSEQMPTLAIKTGGGRRSTLDDDPSGAASSMAAVSQVSASQLCGDASRLLPFA